MGTTRLLLVHAVIAALIGGSAYDIVTDREHWPFSQYPMFASVWRERSLTLLRLYGVEADGREFPLIDHRYVTPFEQSRLPKALRRIARRSDAQQALQRAIRDCFERYDRLRAAQRHDGPPLRAMRLYEVTWTLDPDASNVDRPDSLKLISEYSRGRSLHAAARTTGR
jgi:hypothetical protein